MFKNPLLDLLPRSLRQRQIRRRYLNSVALPEIVVFKTALSMEDRLLSQALSENGQDPRLTSPERKWPFLPCSVNIIATMGEEILATATLVLDSGFGLPSDKHHNLGRLRHQGLALVEVVGVAIRGNSKVSSESLFLPLYRYLVDYSRSVLKADAMILSSRKAFQDLYAGALCFNEYDEGKLLSFENTRDQDIVTQILHFHGMEAEFIDVSGKEKGLHDFFFRREFGNFDFPRPRYAVATNPLLTQAQFLHFFFGEDKLIDDLSTHERLLLADFYRSPGLRRKILGDIIPGYRRSSPRIPARFSASLFNDDHKSRVGEIRQIAREGLALRVKGFDYKIGEKISIVVDLGGSKKLRISGKIVWASADSEGVRLEEVPESWHDLNDSAWYEDTLPALRELSA